MVNEPGVVRGAAVDGASAQLAGVVTRTPLELSVRLSERTGDRVWLKREDLQVVRSYKLRGAYHLIAGLAPEVAARGVVCASAGNHAQGVAYACARLQTPARIFVPRTTPRQKRDRIRTLGGELVELVVEGDSYDDSAALAAADAAESGRLVVPAFDHPDVIAGQGTVVREVCERLEELGGPPGLVVLPVGGGGLLAGCLAWLAAHHPDTPVLAVEPAGAASLTAALGEGRPVALDRVDSFVDGASVRRVGDHPFATIRAYPGPLRVLSVDNGLVCEEMIDLFQTEGVIAEPAGALAPAALRLTSPGTGADVVAVVSGGNQDISRYAEVAERALVSAGLKHYFLVEFPQEPGALRRFLDDVLGPEDDIALFEYVKRTNREYGPALVGIELGAAADLDGLSARLAASPIRAEQIDPDNALFRYLV